MTASPSAIATICRTCQGDARASLACRTCRGAGVSLSSPDGVLMWRAPVDGFVFAFRHIRRQFNRALHFLVALGILACFGFFLSGLFFQETPWNFLSWEGWGAGSWEVASWWLGWLLVCFFIFRVRVYHERAESLPGWNSSRRARHSTSAPLEVSNFFQPAAWALLEEAYGFAKRARRTEVQPVHLFTAALASPAGGICLRRLGLSFDTIQVGLVALLRQGQVGTPTRLSVASKEVLLRAYLNARAAGRKHVGTLEILMEAFLADESLQALLDQAGFPPRHLRQVAEWVRLQEQLRDEHDRFVSLAALKPKSHLNRTMTARPTPLLDHLSEDVTALARAGALAPLVGRDVEMDEILRALEGGRGAVALIGETGVGKTALIEGLARRMVEERVPRVLFDHRLVSVHTAALMASGASDRAIERLLALLHEVAASGNIVLVLEGIEALVGARGGALDVAEALASELESDRFLLIATTTPAAWTASLERRSLGAQLVPIEILPPETEETLRVLMAKSGGIEYQQQVFFSYAALEKTVQLAGRYLHETRLPESALGILKEAAVLVHRERGAQALVTAEDVARIIHEKTHIPVEAVTRDESEKLLALEERLHARVIGQEEAVSAVAQALRRARAQVRESKRPIANFLFLGPTGVGKTELAKALAAEYFGSEQVMIRLDMSEYQQPSSVARVIGDPGDERGGLLSEAVRKQPFSLVLLDELEKAHADILTLFLQVMDDGRLTDGVGRTIDFTNTVLIATSNAGTSFIQDQVRAHVPLEQIKTALLERELKGIFRPEFLNRFDGVIVFKPLSLTEVKKIAAIFLRAIGKRLEEQGITFRVEDGALEELAQAGFDPLFGARPLRRVIQERVENALADVLLRKQAHRRDTFVLERGSTIRIEKGTFSI